MSSAVPIIGVHVWVTSAGLMINDRKEFQYTYAQRSSLQTL